MKIHYVIVTLVIVQWKAHVSAVMNTNHLKEQNLSYFQHLKGAWKEAIKCGIAADVLFIHGLFPWFFDKYWSTYIKKACKRWDI